MTTAKQTHDNHTDCGSERYARGVCFRAENSQTKYQYWLYSVALRQTIGYSLGFDLNRQKSTKKANTT